MKKQIEQQLQQAKGQDKHMLLVGQLQSQNTRKQMPTRAGRGRAGQGRVGKGGGGAGQGRARAEQGRSEPRQG